MVTTSCPKIGPGALVLWIFPNLQKIQIRKVHRVLRNFGISQSVAQPRPTNTRVILSQFGLSQNGNQLASKKGPSALAPWIPQSTWWGRLTQTTRGDNCRYVWEWLTTCDCHEVSWALLIQKNTLMFDITPRMQLPRSYLLSFLKNSGTEFPRNLVLACLKWIPRRSDHEVTCIPFYKLSGTKLSRNWLRSCLE